MDKIYTGCDNCKYSNDDECIAPEPLDCPESQYIEEWRPDPVYQAQYAYACGYYD